MSRRKEVRNEVGLTVQVGREAGPSIDVASLRQFMENNSEWSGMLFEDDSGDYFMPQQIEDDGAVAGIVFSPDPQVVFTYSYGKDNPQRFRRINEPVTITLTLNQ
jgi:hypothetical protein